MTDDLISRAAALGALGFAAWKHEGADAYSQGMDAGARHQAKQDYEAIRALPAAQVQAEPVAPTPPAPDDLDALVAWLHRAYPNDERVSQAADAITALRARPATVQVKPLVWEKSHIAPWYDDWHTVPTGYTIRCADENGWKWSNGQGAFGYDPTASSAKAAAQADYEVRIRAALVASEPAPASHQPPLPSEDAPQAIMDDHNGIGGETPMSILRRIRATTTRLLNEGDAEIAALRANLRHVISERDRTFALMLARAEKAEADLAAASAETAMAYEAAACAILALIEKEDAQ